MTLEQQGAFVELMDQRASGLWRAIFELPFVIEVGSAKLDEKCFAYFITEDLLYLDQFARVLALGSVHAEEPEVQRRFLQRADVVFSVEEALHGNVGKLLGLDPGKVRTREPAPVTLAYTDHLMRVALTSPLSELVAAVLPCYLVYGRVGQELAQRPPEHEIYATWIRSYDSPEFAQAVRDQCLLADRLWMGADGRTRERMERWFIRSLRYEWMFWDQAYRLAGWPCE